jgi:hypothetical protein
VPNSKEKDKPFFKVHKSSQSQKEQILWSNNIAESGKISRKLEEKIKS